jgi:acyl carrier protein
MMEKRLENLNFINKILVIENAKAIQEDNLLIDSELDSFGYAILFIEIDEKFNCFDKEYLNSIDYKTYTMKDLLNRIEK